MSALLVPFVRSPTLPTSLPSHRPQNEPDSPSPPCTPATHEADLAAAIHAARTHQNAPEADRLCWRLALTVQRGIAAEIRALPAWRRAILDPDELRSVGLMGAFKAAGKFDPARGRFTTYARLWIRQELRRVTGEQAGVVRLPENAQARLQRLQAGLRAGVGLDVLAAREGAAVAELEGLLAAALPACRLDAPTPEGDLRDTLPDGAPSAEAVLLRQEAHDRLPGAMAAVLAEPGLSGAVRWALLMDPFGVEEPAVLAALRRAMEGR